MVENKLGYRSNKYVREYFDKNPDNSHKNAMPFRYYTILAGIRLGKIKITAQIVDDLKWIKKGNPGLLPKGFDPEDPKLLTDPSVQQAALQTLSNQYSEAELKGKLIQARTNFLSDDVVKIANTERTAAFHLGRNTIPKMLAMGGITTAIAIAFGATMLLTTGMQGLENGFFEQLLQIMSNPVNAIGYAIPPLIGDIIVGSVSDARHKAFIRKYEALNTQEKAKLYKEIEQVMQLENSKDKEAAIERLNTKYKGIFGDKKDQIMANYSMLERSIGAYHRGLQRRIEKPLARKAGKEVKSDIQIRNSGDIMNFIRSLGISNDSPFYSIVENVVSKVNGYTKGTPKALAYQTVVYEEAPRVVVADHETNVDVVENDNPIVDDVVDNSSTVVSSADLELTRSIKAVREKIESEYVKSKTIVLDQLGYEIQITKTGVTELISGLDDKLKTVLSHIESTIREGEEEEFIIQNTKSKKPIKLGKIELGKKVSAGDDTITIKVVKKKPTNGPKQ